MIDLKFKLSPNCLAEVTFTGTPTREAMEKFIELLQLSKDTFPANDEAAAVAD